MSILSFIDFIEFWIKIAIEKEVLFGSNQPKSSSIMYFRWVNNQLQSKHNENWQINGCFNQNYSIEFTRTQTKSMIFSLF